MNIKELFDAAAQDYDRTRPQYIPCFEEFYGAAIGLIAQGPQDRFRVLDLGAGTGLLSALIATAFPRATLTLADVSDEMLVQAKARFAKMGKRITVLAVDYVRAPLTGQYDVIASALSLHHTPQDKLPGVFQKIAGALRAGGLFINADQCLGPTGAIEERYQAHWLAQVRAKGCTAADLAVALERMKADRTATLEDQLAWLRSSGFIQADCWYKNYRFAVYSGQKPRL